MSDGLRRGRGRPALVHDNRRVRDFMSVYCTPGEAVEDFPWLGHVLTGTVYLQTEGQASTRPLSKWSLFLALQLCDAISTEDVAVAIGQDYSRATIARYTATARVASKAIERELDRRPS